MPATQSQPWNHGTAVAARSEDIESGDRVFGLSVGFGTVVNVLEHGYLVRPARPEVYANNYVQADEIELVDDQEYPKYTG